MMFDPDLSESYKSRSNMFLRQTTTVPQYSCGILFKGNHSNSKLWIIPHTPHVYNEGKNSQLGKELLSGKICQRVRLKRISLPLQSFGNLIDTEKCARFPRACVWLKIIWLSFLEANRQQCIIPFYSYPSDLGQTAIPTWSAEIPLVDFTGD